MTTEIALAGQAVQLTYVAMQMGALEYKGRFLQSSANKNSTQDNLASDLVLFAKEILEQQKVVDNLWGSIYKAADRVSQIYKTQCCLIQKALESSKECAINAFCIVLDVQFIKLNNCFDRAKEALNDYRNNPLRKNLQEAVREIDNFEEETSRIQRFHERFSKLDPGNEYSVGVYSSAVYRMQILIAYQEEGKFGNLYTRLKLACQQDCIEDAIKKGLQKEFSNYSFKEESLNCINKNIYKYDNLKEFHKDFLNAMTKNVETPLKPLMNDYDLSEFYENLHRLAFGPEEVNPKVWVQSELPSIVSLDPTAIDNIGKPQKEAFLGDDETSSEHTTSGDSLDETVESNHSEDGTAETNAIYSIDPDAIDNEKR